MSRSKQFQRKHITDEMVIRAYLERKLFENWPYHILMEQTGYPLKVCYSAMERAYDKGYIEFGTSLRSGWVTEKGMELIRESEGDDAHESNHERL